MYIGWMWRLSCDRCSGSFYCLSCFTKYGFYRLFRAMPTTNIVFFYVELCYLNECNFH
ncbi:hypothetical protein EVA_02783 [gut metagenome]|uniref:Uncharacterized protein n=1 Tax=gut metagenome TaxID=749906 RepID=J9H0F8_9ZZZZ